MRSRRLRSRCFRLSRTPVFTGVCRKPLMSDAVNFVPTLNAVPAPPDRVRGFRRHPKNVIRLTQGKRESIQLGLESLQYFALRIGVFRAQSGFSVMLSFSEWFVAEVTSRVPPQTRAPITRRACIPSQGTSRSRTSPVRQTRWLARARSPRSRSVLEDRECPGGGR